jgi:nucleoid-associated protein YgaU
VKLLIGVLLLLVTFVAAAMWQRSWRAEAEMQRTLARSDEQRSRSVQSDEEREGWGRVIVGRPSGADPAPPIADRPATQLPTSIPTQNARPTTAEKTGSRPGQGGTALPSSASSSETRIVVKSGETLSSLCQTHYGTSRPEVLQALALYNNLKDPNNLREGQSLAVPPLERLLDKNPR